MMRRRGSAAREVGGAFFDPSNPLELRRQRHPRDQHHRHDACYLRGYGLCPKHFRGAVRPPVEFACHHLCGFERPVPSREAPRSEGGVAYCVRLCDGRYFPI